MTEPINIQDVFNVAIESGHYHKDHINWMCGSLLECKNQDLISDDEYKFAIAEIREYLAPTGKSYLDDALEQSGLPYDFEDRLTIYEDWANRPDLRPKSMPEPEILF